MNALSDSTALRPAPQLLPPPWPIILLYAVQGWARHKRIACAPGRRLPARAAWLPVFIRLLHRPDACRVIADYAATGLDADHLPVDLSHMVERALRRPDALSGMVEALAFASTR